MLYSVRRLIGSLLANKKSDNNNRMNQLTNVFCVLFTCNGAAIFDYNKRLILLSVIQLSGGHCIHIIFETAILNTKF
jgi:hypothetical protein